MSPEEKALQVDWLIEQLEEASSVSKSATNGSWEQFCKFLDNFQAVLDLHEPETCDIASVTKRRQICYYVTSEDTDRSPQSMASVCEILPRVGKLVRSELFPSETDFHIYCDWLQMVIFLFEVILPESNSTISNFAQLMNQVLESSRKLIQLCTGCFKREKIHQSELAMLNSYAFEKVSYVAKLGVSQEVPLDTNLKAIELMQQVALLMKESQFVGALDKDKFDLLGGGLWSIVETELRNFVICSYSYYYKASKLDQAEYEALKKATLSLAELLPDSDTALEFFLEKLTKKSPPATSATDLALLYSILRPKDFKAEGVWPVLDIHMSRSDPIVRNCCLSIATGFLEHMNMDSDEFKCLKQHLVLITQNVSHDEAQDHHRTRIRLVQLILAICKRKSYEVYVFCKTLDKVLLLILAQPPNEDNVNLATQVIKTFETYIDLNALLTWACDHFKSIYRSGDAQSQVALLRALGRMIEATGFDYGAVTRYNVSSLFVQIIESDCDGVAPEGCNQAMFSLLKTARLVAPQSDSAVNLLTIAHRVYDKEAPCKIYDWHLGTFKENKKAFRGQKDAIEAFLELCHQDLSQSALCIRMGGPKDNCSNCTFAIEALA